MTVATDPILALVTFLRADPAVAALAGTRVFSYELPRSEVTGQTEPQATVVLKPAGGGLLGQAYQEHGDERVDVDCWGATPKDARALYWTAVYPALKQLRRQVHDGTLLHWALPSSKAVTLRDPITDWPVCASSWQVLAAEVA